MRFLVPLIFLGCVLSGCSGDPIQQKMMAMHKEKCQKASLMYVFYVAENGYVGPANVEEMVEFLSTDKKAARKLKMIGLGQSNLEDYLIGRDGEPFRFRWSVKSNPASPPYPICFEESGVDGVRRVGFAGGKIVEVSDDAEYERLFKGKVSKKIRESLTRP